MLIEFRIPLIDVASCKVKGKDVTKGHLLVLKGGAENLCGTRTTSLERDA